MSTWTIDDMPESERRKRTIFRDRVNVTPEPAPAAAQQPEPDPAQYIHVSEFDRFRNFILDALAGFPEARAAVMQAVKAAIEQRQPEGSPA